MGAKGWDIPVSNMVHAHRKVEATESQQKAQGAKGKDTTTPVMLRRRHETKKKFQREREKPEKIRRQTHKERATQRQSESRPFAVFGTYTLLAIGR